MLSNLSIKNYALIQKLDVSFTNNFCVITGETGAGKSIIMGALALILGQRADTSVLNDTEAKCVVEGRFNVADSIDLKLFFEQNDLDYELPVLLRREITPAGKSRAFVNDTPVQLTVIRELGLMLIDIHSQHSNLELGKRRFQLNVIDWFAGHSDLLQQYSVAYKALKKLQRQQTDVQEKSAQAKADLDYFEFQFNQLAEAKLKDGELAELEQEQELLTHSEDIKLGLSQVYQLLDVDELAVLPKLKDASNVLQKLSSYLPDIKNLSERVQSQYIEMQDVAAECEHLAEKTEHDPARLEAVTDRLNMLYSLLQKHRVETITELIALHDEFDQKIQSAASYDEELEKLAKLIATSKKEVGELAAKLHESRAKQLPAVENEIEEYLHQLGMPNAAFKVELNTLEEFQSTGTDEVIFLFVANKGGRLEEITKVASGGEMSRLMLAIKTVVAKSKALPAIIFDEIDTGISGEIAGKMGRILKTMSEYMQVINITHLPQIASKGDSHYQVFKSETANSTVTGMRILNSDERVVEIAKMLSGDVPTNAALENAKSLLAQV